MPKTWEQIAITKTVVGYQKTLPNGLLVCLVPMPEYLENYVQFTTRYGSVNRTFIHPETQEEYAAPDGVAHFLEHKLFDQPDGSDVMLEFSKLSANPNAFTSHTQTTYYFSANKNVEKATELLLDYVQTPYFTDASVEKEKGIIAQEIEMYEDQFGWVGYREALHQSFPNHPVGIDIAGTVDSIYAITKEDLYACYETFYHPSNMQFVMVGPFDLAAMQKLIEENQAGKEYVHHEPVQKILPIDDSIPAAKARKKKIDAQTNYVTAILKDVQRDTLQPEREELVVDILLDMLFSDISEYRDMFERENIVDGGLSYFANYEDNYAYSIMQVQTKEPNTFIAEYKKCWYEAASVTPEQFDLVKKTLIGVAIQAESSTGYIARELSAGIHRGITPLKQVEILDTITYEDVRQKYEQLLAGIDEYLSFVLLEGNSNN